MADASDLSVSLQLPALPVPVKDFISYFASATAPVTEILEPYKAYESELRKVYAQQPYHEAVKDGFTNTVPVFAGHEAELKIRARSLSEESQDEKDKYIMPLNDAVRKKDGSPAIVSSIKEFQMNFSIFSESSLSDLDWNNVVVAGSAVTTSLLPVPEKWNESKRSLREYYHEKLAPASDVDLFLYGLTEEEGVEKIKQIERNIKDSILGECTTIRTKNAITIASQYPTRHVQIVLRLYDSISQIITGFDVDCSCAAYNGSQVLASPRALASFATQTNIIDLTRRSPSYESRLSKYSHRGFEVHFPLLDRSRIDPTIFERSFSRTLGLARLLVLEKLPKTVDRDAYMDKRRLERGRPAANRNGRDTRRHFGNIKDEQEDDIAEWVIEDQVSNYHTMVVPYGKKFTAAKIIKLLYTKDLLLNSEWNLPKDREVNLHRHPCFFGAAEDVIGDCCGHCPKPITEEELAVAEEESKTYISGELKFVKDDPGRQSIGSFNPVTTDDWTEMAFVGNTQMLCQAIVDGDLDYVQSWCTQEGNDVNTRDYCGRTPLHLAVISGQLDIVQCLIDNNARMVFRLVDGRTALHLAAAQGEIAIVKALMKRSLENEEEEANNEIKKKTTKNIEAESDESSEESDESDSDMSDGELVEDSEGSDDDSVTIGSVVKIKAKTEPKDSNDIPEDNKDDPDIFDINVLAWDTHSSPLHLAIANGNVEMITLLVEEYGADVMLPIKHENNLSGGYSGSSDKTALLTLVIAISLPVKKAKQVVALLLKLGASCAQADMNHFTSLHFMVGDGNTELLNLLFEWDRPAAQAVLNIVNTDVGLTALRLAIQNSDQSLALHLLTLGARPFVSFDEYIKSYISRNSNAKSWNTERSMKKYLSTCTQPLIAAALKGMAGLVKKLIENGADPMTLNTAAHEILEDQDSGRWKSGSTLLDIVRTQLETLREHGNKSMGPDEPEILKEKAFYLTGLKPDTYKYFTALQRYNSVKRETDKAREDYKKMQSQRSVAQPGEEEKKKAILDLILQLEEVETKLVQAGAKTFREAHPEISEPYKNNNSSYKHPEPLPHETFFTFNLPDLNDDQKEGYLRLFEAVWQNDVDEVKMLTLSPWKTNTGIEMPPLKIAVQDSITRVSFSYHSGTPERRNFSGFSPFSLAVLRGHQQLARAILDIAHAQYQPEEAGVRKRWTIETYEEDYDTDSDSDSDEPNIFGHLVDDNFTIDNILAVSDVVKSHVKPSEMVGWVCNAPFFSNDEELNILKKSVTNDAWALVDYAVKVDDMSTLRFLLEIGAERHALDSDDREPSRGNFTASNSTFTIAIQLGRTAILAELIRLTGAGIPLDDLVEKSGLVITEKPKFYQGLSIAGKKRVDWAQAGRPDDYSYQNKSVAKTTPLLEAARLGSIESVQWFLSDAPARRYKEFGASHKFDKRVQVLEKLDGGFEGTINAWLGVRNELAMHCAILGSDSCETDAEYAIFLELLQYLVSVMPDCLDHKSVNGWTPLHVAMTMREPKIVKILLEAGANPRIRDSFGRNVMHNAMVSVTPRRVPLSDPKCLRELITLFNQKDIKEMLLERCSIGEYFSSVTPLAYWMEFGTNLEIVKIMTDYSAGDDLELIDGQGDLPLHVAVKKSLCAITSFLISLRPSLLHRENATGRTALEMAQDAQVQDVVTKVPQLSLSSWYSYQYEQGDLKILTKPAIEFHTMTAEEERVAYEKLVSKKRTYEICFEAAEAMGPSKRHLVSLWEANEVAKRLAGTKAIGLDGTVFVDGQWKKKSDEVVEDEVSRLVAGYFKDRH